MNKPAQKGTNLGWHQDRFPALDREPRITFYTPLDPATLENGCVWVIPKSHRSCASFLSGDEFSQQVEKNLKRYGSISLELDCGEVVLLHNWLLHTSGVNQTDMPRRAFSVCYMDAATRLVEDCFLNRIDSCWDGSFSLIFGKGALSVDRLRVR